MSKTYEYKGFLITNIPYKKSEPRWFIKNNDGTTNEPLKYPTRTLKESKEKIDMFLNNISK